MTPIKQLLSTPGLFLILCFTAICGVTSLRAQISVENLVTDELLQYPLALLKGTCHEEASHIIVHDIKDPDNHLTFPAVEGKFKALWMLKKGGDTLVLNDGINVPISFPLNYSPIESGKWIRPVYLLASDSDGTFDAPSGESNDTQSAVHRFAVGALLMQTFTAEKMSEAGYGRKTFRLQYDKRGMPKVEVIRTNNKVEDYFQTQSSKGDYAYYSMVLGDLANLPERDDSKDIVIPSFTRYDGTTRTIQGHTALGTDRLGLCSSATLHTWAENIEQITDRFSDTSQIDTSDLFDDSVGRGSHWANYATGLGATLHELGHTLGLPHTDQYHPMPKTGIMWRGFDNLNLAFMVQQPDDASTYYDKEAGAFWHPESARLLNRSAWMHPPASGFPMPNCVPHIHIQENHIVLRWNANPGTTYQLLFSETIDTTIWTPVFQSIQATANEVVLNTLKPTYKAGFYQIQTETHP